MLRAAGEADIPAVVALMNLAFRAAGPTAGWNSEADYIAGERTSEPLFREELRGHPRATLLVEDGERGLAASVLVEDIGDGVWHLGALAVDPGLQNGGFGRRVLEEAEAWARERGARTIRIKVVNVRDTLIAWYVRRGYVPTGETEPFPYGDNRFGVPRRADLAFVLLDKVI